MKHVKGLFVPDTL